MSWLDKLTGKNTTDEVAPQQSPIPASTTDYSNMSYEDLSKNLLVKQLEQMDNPIDPTRSAFMTEDFSVKNLLGDRYAMGNMIGLAGTLMQAASLPSMLKNAKLQNESLKFNLDTAKQEQGRRNSNISAFNSFRG